MTAPGRRGHDERGTGLIELLVAAWLGVLALTVLAALARGPLAAAMDRSAGRPEVDGALLLREALSGSARAARSDGSGPAVAAAGPDHLVLRVPRAAGPGWWRLTVSAGVVRIGAGTGPVPSGADADLRVLPLAPSVSHVLVRDATGAEIAGPGSGDRALGARDLATAALVELHLTGEPSRVIAVALRPG